MSQTATVTCTTYGYCSKCDAHRNGTVTTGSIKKRINGNSVARVGDTVQASCGHTGTINAGNNKVLVEGKAQSRINDAFSGTYTGTITSGSSTHNTGA